MTMKPRVSKFRIRKSARGEQRTTRNTAHPPDDSARDPDADATASIRAEGLTGRQLRLARRVAQKNGLSPESDIDAVRQLRARGIDPFQRTNMLDLVVTNARKDGDNDGPAARRPQLPQTYRHPQTPSTDFAAPAGAPDEVMQIQHDIARRRRRRMILLAARLCVFVLLPTLVVGHYYFNVATPLYATHSQFVIQKADMQAAAAGGGMGSLFSGTSLATSQDSITVQSYLQSREAMQRLDREHGFKAHFSQPRIDPLKQLPPDASDEAAYDLYQDYVNIGYDPTEGVIKMEVIAADPETSQTFSEALISYAEEQVDQLTQRMRADQMEGARENYEDAEREMQEARQRVVEMQEKYDVLSSEVEVELLTRQISQLESQLTEERLDLQELQSNERPNQARVAPVERRIANLRSEISNLRGQLTQSREGRESIARIRSELVMAEADVETRQMMLARALEQLEIARVEANRQVRYLSTGVSPVAPDEATYPRAAENTALALVIFAGLYLMASMTASILREQVSA